MKKIALIALLTLVFGCLFFAGCNSPHRQGSFAPEVLAEFNVLNDANDANDANFIFLPVRFDGEEYLFCLDTGSTTTIFDASLKDKLGKRILWPKKGTVAGGKSIKVEYFPTPHAYLGPLNLKGRTIIGVVDLEQVSSALAKKAHGIIGMDFLKKYIVRIDCDRATVSFLKSRRDTGIFSFLQPENNEHPEWGQPLSIKYEFRSGLPLVKGRIGNDIPVNFMIDTGNVSPYCDGDLKSSIFKKVRSKVELQTKEDFNKAAMIDKFSIGSFEYRDAVFYQSNYSSLGLEFLRRHLVTFDFPNRKMYLKKGKHFDRPTNIHVSIEDLGFDLRRHRNNIVVDSIDQNGPAYKKGIRQNDIIVKLDDQDVTSYSLTGLLTLLRLLPTDIENLVITIKRGDDIKNFSFALKKHDTQVDPNAAN